MTEEERRAKQARLLRTAADGLEVQGSASSAAEMRARADELEQGLSKPRCACRSTQDEDPCIEVVEAEGELCEVCAEQCPQEP